MACQHTFPTISITLYLSNSYLTTLKLYLYKNVHVTRLSARATCTHALPLQFLVFILLCNLNEQCETLFYLSSNSILSRNINLQYVCYSTGWKIKYLFFIFIF